MLGTGIPSADDWIATDYPMIQTGTGHLDADHHRRARPPPSSTSSPWAAGTPSRRRSRCAYVANRAFGFDTADASYTATDTVAAWEGIGSC